MTATQPQKTELYDVEKVRQEARQSIEEGAITEDYPLDLEQTYKLLNEALASEILCVLRYRHHEVIAKGINYPQVAAEFAEHAASEHEHMMVLAERIDQLGGDPDFNPATIVQRSSTEYGSSGPNVELVELIKEDLVAERVVIEIYRKLVNYFGNADPTTRRLIEQLLADEEDHASDLADLIAAVDPRKKPV
ncbi:ferritin-like domain-containing protein [Phormidium sp. CCY1219]|uniref:ferritin-like domain-containing protein n=1 Tax=Phormidium sp. CCY1219 TaxID=2886104 RepID=UPI002D1F0F3A|nr:ferritin-like domain-containing protein [Phormidium sp. CCY1219]MEB3830892.1 ferritin-like domain-containing protein [Phormidium sp. CCY1219]